MIQRYPSYLKGPLSFASVVNITASLVEFDLFSTEGKVMVCYVKLSGSWNTILFINQHCKCCCNFLISTFPAVEVSEYYFKFKSSASLCCLSLRHWLERERRQDCFIFKTKQMKVRKTFWPCGLVFILYFLYPERVCYVPVCWHQEPKLQLTVSSMVIKAVGCFAF